MDNVLQTELLLNMLNTVFAKAVHFKDKALILKLNALRHDIYYSDLGYDNYMKTLEGIDEELKKYE